MAIKSCEAWGEDSHHFYFPPQGTEPRESPRFGIPYDLRLPGDIVAEYRPTKTVYYFKSLGDIPPPEDDWCVWVWEIDEWGEIKTEEQTWLTRWARKWMKKIGVFEAIAFVTLFSSLIGAPAALASIISAIQEKLDAIWKASEGVRRTLLEKIEAAKSLYAKFAQRIHLDELLMIDRVLELTWDTYREKKSEFLRRVGAISEELFGDVHVLNQWIDLAGMAFTDWALLEGYDWNERDMRWLVRSAKFLEGVEDRLETYARHPERLWMDVENELVRPIYEARAEKLSRSEKARNRIAKDVALVKVKYSGLDRRLREYQLALPDTMKETWGAGIEKFRNDLHEFWNDDLRTVLDDIQYAVSVSKTRLAAIKKAQTKIRQSVNYHQKMLSPPTSLTPQDATEQKEIFSSIQNDIAKTFNDFAWKVLESENPKWGETYKKIWEGK